jgi:anti-anti-sigma factor
MNKSGESGEFPNPIELSTKDDKAIVKVSGVLDMSNNDLVESILKEQLALEEIQTVLADLVECEFIDEMGIKTLIAVNIAARDLEKEFQVIARTDSPVLSRVKLVGLEQVLNLEEID